MKKSFAQTLALFAIRKALIRDILLFIVLIPIEVSAQEVKLSETIVSIAEDLASSDADQEAASAYIDRLYELAENPVNLNSANQEEISRLFFLTDFQVKALADYSRTTGRIISFNELAYIPGFDRTTAEIIAPFATISRKESTISDSLIPKGILITNLSLKSGNHDSVSLGSQLKVLTKYKFIAGNFSGGFTFEKDQGEKFFCPGTMSPDFFSANMSYAGKGIVRRVILGDFSARFGQGTNINTGISTGLSLTSQGYISASNEIRPYTSTDENVFFRGIASQIAIKNTEISVFCSRKNLDATIGTSNGNSGDFIENLYKSGTHNTSALLQKKDAVSESVYGINISSNFRTVRMGLAWSENRFSLPVLPDYSNPEKIFSFSGRTNDVCSFYYSSMIKRILLYGEMATNDIKKYSIVQGLSFRPSDRLIINFMYRKTSPGFISFHGKGPGGSSESYPEKSMLGNFTFEAAKHLFVRGGCYIQHFPWLKYRCSSPSKAVKQEAGIRYMPSDKLTFDWLYGYRFSMTDNSSFRAIPALNQTISRSLKMVCRYSVNDNLIIGTRIDYRIIDPSGSKGVDLLQELSFAPRSIPVKFWLRYCIFNTRDYDSRIYVWENDLLYTYSIPALYGKGSRFYVMAAWKIKDRAELRFKYGVLSDYGNSNAGADKEEFRLQLKIII